LNTLSAKYQKELQHIKNEMTASENVIKSLKNECESYKESLNKQFHVNDDLKAQLDRLNNQLKGLEGVKQIFSFLLFLLVVILSDLTNLINQWNFSQKRMHLNRLLKKL
jgi:septal ring factor EnvC (AmiA/AmiB activator)